MSSGVAQIILAIDTDNAGFKHMPDTHLPETISCNDLNNRPNSTPLPNVMMHDDEPMCREGIGANVCALGPIDVNTAAKWLSAQCVNGMANVDVR